jgi:hypothetical protein
MMLLFLELDVCIMNLLMFQENHGIHLAYQELEKDNQGAHQGEGDLDFLRY